MKSINHFLILLISTPLASCCLVTSQDCGCEPPTPFIDQQTIVWQEPTVDESLLFVNSNNDSIIVTKEYILGSECYGGDECCSDFEKHNTTWYLTKDNFNETTLINLESFRNSVTFNTRFGGYGPPNFIYSINTSTNSINSNDKYLVSYNDTIVNQSELSQLKIELIDNTNAEFKSLTFVQSIGVIEFIDLEATRWVKK